MSIGSPTPRAHPGAKSPVPGRFGSGLDRAPRPINNPMMVAPVLVLGTVLWANAPQSMQMSDGVGTSSTTIISSTRSGRARLSLLRADGVELAWIEGPVRLPGFGESSLSPSVIEFEAPNLDPVTGTTDGVGESIRLSVDRTTALRDGGISGAAGSLGGDDGLMRLTTLAADEGEYDIYDLTVAWDAVNAGPVSMSVIGGLKAIDARIGKTVDEGGVSSFRDARGLVAVPVIGGGVDWRVTDHVAMSGRASTQTFAGQGTVFDLSAETTIRLTPNIGLSAGYQFIRSAIEVQSLDAELEREGVFARIQIRF